MKLRKRLGALMVLVGLLVGLMPLVAGADHDGNTNQASYWEAHYANHNAVCFYHEGDSSHGDVVNSATGDGEAVKLNTFQQSWPGDHWEALIVKGGSAQSTQNGLGYVVYNHPEANVKYDAPIGNNGNVKEVSHWIVCKGETPEQGPTEVFPDTPTTETFCDVDGEVFPPDDTAEITYEVKESNQAGKVKIVASLTSDDFVFGTLTGGWILNNNPSKAHINVTIPVKTSDCGPVVPVAPTENPATCLEDGTVVLPPEQDNVTYTLEDDGVRATLDVDFVFDLNNLNGFVIQKDGTAFFAITPPAATGDCIVVPAEPTETGPSCLEDGSINLPDNTDDVAYTEVEGGVLATPAEGVVLDVTGTDFVLNQDGTAFFAIEADEATGDCLVTPVQPKVTQSDACGVEGSVVIPYTDDVIYILEGEEGDVSGQTINGPTSGTILAIAAEGHVIADGAQTEFDFDVPAAEECTTPTTPETTTTTTPVEEVAVSVDASCDAIDIGSDKVIANEFTLNGEAVSLGQPPYEAGTYTAFVTVPVGYTFVPSDNLSDISAPDVDDPVGQSAVLTFTIDECDETPVTTPTTVPEDEPEELPFTGFDNLGLWAAVASALILAGGGVLAFFRREDGEVA